jgi:hypothetical protein
MKKDYWRWVERGISIAAIVGMFVAWQSDRAKWKTILDNVVSNDEKRTEYWNRQNEINGRILMYMQLDAAGSGTGTEEEGP